MAKKYIDADRLKQIIADNVYPVQDAFNSRDYGMFWTGGIEKAIDEQPAVDIEPRWIPVTERLPEFGDRTLVTIPTISGLYVSIGTYAYEREWHVKDYGFCRKVIAWMPLPEPYKEGEQNG